MENKGAPNQANNQKGERILGKGPGVAMLRPPGEAFGHASGRPARSRPASRCPRDSSPYSSSPWVHGIKSANSSQQPAGCVALQRTPKNDGSPFCPPPPPEKKKDSPTWLDSPRAPAARTWQSPRWRKPGRPLGCSALAWGLRRPGDQLNFSSRDQGSMFLSRSILGRPLLRLPLSCGFEGKKTGKTWGSLSLFEAAQITVWWLSERKPGKPWRRQHKHGWNIWMDDIHNRWFIASCHTLPPTIMEDDRMVLRDDFSFEEPLCPLP